MKNKFPHSSSTILMYLAAVVVVLVLAYANFGPRHNFAQYYLPIDLLHTIGMDRESIRFLRKNSDELSHLIAGFIITAIFIMAFRLKDNQLNKRYLLCLCLCALITFSLVELAQYITRSQLWCGRETTTLKILKLEYTCENLKFSFSDITFGFVGFLIALTIFWLKLSNQGK